LKIGEDEVFFKNPDGSITLTYSEVSGEGAGLSHVTTYGPGAVVPLPAALPLFAGGLGAFGVLGWRRKRKAASA